jgi:HPr kinase/phosphorylase
MRVDANAGAFLSSRPDGGEGALYTDYSPMIVNIHASCVVLAAAADAFGAPPDAGVLLLGASGTGKSDLALRLIERGALLVADDRCELFMEGDAIRARAPAALAGLIEVRGLGIMALPCAGEARIALVTRLAVDRAIVRLPRHARYRPPEPLAAPKAIWPPEIWIAPFEPSAPAKLAIAVAGFAEARFREGISAP